VKKERDSLQEENRRLKTMLNEESAAPTSGNTKYLKNKVFFFLINNLDLPS
jgi:hypothetical protein